jgi:hypothetical protein
MDDTELIDDETFESIDLDKSSNIIEWTPEHEQLLIEWGDKAMCYRWLHSKANSMFSSLNTWYTIPVIVISTLTGTANFAQERVPLNFQNYFVMIVGGFNILAGIITTIQQFLKITQLNEAHRVSSIAWDKFYRNIKVEIAKHPHERIEVRHMIKLCKDEFDRLMETCPSIPDKIIQEFKVAFKESETFKEVVKPEICDILISTNEFRNQWFNDENKTKVFDNNLRIKKIKDIKQKKAQELNNTIVKEFIISFKNLNNREPMETEIIDNLKDKMNIKVLEKILEQNKLNMDNNIIIEISNNSNNSSNNNSSNNNSSSNNSINSNINNV